MPACQAVIYGDFSQSTIASTVSNSQTSITLASSAGFVTPSSGQIGVARIDDTGNAAWTQTSGPFEIVAFGSNSSNILGSLQRGYDGTTAKSFSAGATVTQVPPAAGLNLIPQQIGTLTLASTAAQLIFTSIPAGFGTLLGEVYGRSTTAGVSIATTFQFNNDNTATYDYIKNVMANTTSVAPTQGNAATFADIGYVPGAGSAANAWSHLRFEINNYSNTFGDKNILTQFGVANAYSSGNLVQGTASAWWHPASPAVITSIQIGLPGGAAWAINSKATLYVLP